MLPHHQRGIIHLGIIGLVVLTAGLFAVTKLASNKDLTFFNIAEDAKGINEQDQCGGCQDDRELRWRKNKNGGRCVSIPSSKCARKTQPTPKPPSKCVVAGCNSDLCVDESQKDLATTCVVNPAQSCYKTAKCEKQADGKCGWTQTAGLKSCLDIPLCGSDLYCKGQTSGIEGATRCRDKDHGTILSCCPSGLQVAGTKCQ